MAIHAAEFLTCTECGNGYFREEKQIMFRTSVLERADKTVELPALKYVVAYKCTRCGHELNK